jgi:hypothetical protein
MKTDMCTFLIISGLILRRMRNVCTKVSQQEYHNKSITTRVSQQEYHNTHFVFGMFFLFSKIVR